MTMLSFRVDDREADEAQRWVEALGIARSELLREALRRHLDRLASEGDADRWAASPLDEGERAPGEIADWGPAEDWSDWGRGPRGGAAMTESGELSIAVIGEDVTLVYACPHCCTGGQRVTVSFPLDQVVVTRIARGLIDYSGINHSCRNCGQTFLLTAGEEIKAVFMPYRGQLAVEIQDEARQLFWRAKEAMDGGDFAAAEQQYADLGKRYGAEPDSELRMICATALVNRAMILASRLRRFEDAVGVCDGIVAAYGDPSGGDPAEQVAKALLTRATALADLGRLEEAVAACKQIRSTYGDDREPAIEAVTRKAALLESQLAPG